MVGKKRKPRRAKYIMLYSPFLMKETKHELIGEPIETPQGRQQWAKCTKSRHAQLINLDAIESQIDKSKAIVHISREDAKKYTPVDEYEIGDIIFHSVWDDVGIVRSKETLSDGSRAIVVHFEKSNEKRLIEKLKH